MHSFFYYNLYIYFCHYINQFFFLLIVSYSIWLTLYVDNIYESN